jgi:isoamylase
MATLAFSQGVPMISHGDELGRSQAGNNNAYCHDSALSWVDWNLSPPSVQFLEFTRAVFAMRTRNPVLRRRTFFRREERGEAGKDLAWLRPDGQEMTDAEWNDPANHVLGMLIRGEATDEVDERGRRLLGEAILLLVNGGARTKPFSLPELDGGAWVELIDTAHPLPRALRQNVVNLAAHSLMLLRYEAPR